MNPDRSPKLSICIPTRNRQACLERLFKSLAAQTFADFEVVLVDDASDVPLTCAYPWSRVIRLDRQGGQCNARNVAIRSARGELMLFLDDDTELLDPDLLRRTVAYMDEHPAVGALGLCQLQPGGEPGMNPADLPAPCQVSTFFGCGFVIRRETDLQAGGFTAMLEYYYDEFEYCMRVVDRGWQVVYHPGLRLVHYHDPKGRDWRRLHRLISRNAIYTIVLRFPWWLVGPAVARQLVQFVRMGMAENRRDLAGLWWVARQVTANLPRCLAQRRAVRFASLRLYKDLQRRPRLMAA